MFFFTSVIVTIMAIIPTTVVEAVRDKPPIAPPSGRQKPIINKPKAPSPKKNNETITEIPNPVETAVMVPESDSGTDESEDVQVGKVIKTKTLTRVFNNYNKLRNTYDNDSPTEELTEISLTRNNDTDDDEEDQRPRKHKKHKKKTKIEDEDLTATITDITATVNDTMKTIGKSIIIELLKKVFASKQFMIICILCICFGGVGYLLRIVFGKL